ncbi:MAG TPA: hypothetical protein PLX89_03340 [Verrucomicrobiota bacterium]|nr:hypothetical protein [Verrucomicrobiales bacterium]HRI12017.1 hypothetical protein [Verrucomicrobiota bacterium]
MSESPKDLVREVRNVYDADVIVYFGPISRPHDDTLITQCRLNKQRKNVVLCIATLGGDANPAYRIARTLQKHYATGKEPGKVFAYVVSICASAGTLLVLGADELILSPHAELGPVDVQLRRNDEVGERTSGLTPVQALEYLREEGVNLFQQHFMAMRFGEDLSFPTSIASKVAAEITSGCLGKLYEQIDPLRVAEINRTLLIAMHYGNKIDKNLKPGAFERLLRGYPAHDCVIDPEEAKELFKTISDPKEPLSKLGDGLKPLADKLLFSKQAKVAYLFEETNEHTEPDGGDGTVNNGAAIQDNGQPREANPKVEAAQEGETVHKRS